MCDSSEVSVDVDCEFSNNPQGYPSLVLTVTTNVEGFMYPTSIEKVWISRQELLEFLGLP